MIEIKHIQYPMHIQRVVWAVLLLAVCGGAAAQRGTMRLMGDGSQAAEMDNTEASLYDASCDARASETAATAASRYWWLRTSQFLMSLK
jgi:hypothetical protein